MGLQKGTLSKRTTPYMNDEVGFVLFWYFFLIWVDKRPNMCMKIHKIYVYIYIYIYIYCSKGLKANSDKLHVIKGIKG